MAFILFGSLIATLGGIVGVLYGIRTLRIALELKKVLMEIARKSKTCQKCYSENQSLQLHHRGYFRLPQYWCNACRNKASQKKWQLGKLLFWSQQHMTY